MIVVDTSALRVFFFYETVHHALLSAFIEFDVQLMSIDEDNRPDSKGIVNHFIPTREPKRAALAFVQCAAFGQSHVPHRRIYNPRLPISGRTPMLRPHRFGEPAINPLLDVSLIPIQQIIDKLRTRRRRPVAVDKTAGSI